MGFQNRKFEITRYLENDEDSNLLNEFLIEESFKSKKKQNIYHTIFEFTNKFPPFIYF